MRALKVYRSVLLVVLLFAELVLGLVDPAIAAQPVTSSNSTASSVQTQAVTSDCQSGKGFGLNSVGKSLLSRLQTAAGTGGVIACHDYTGVVRFLSTEPGKPIARSANLPAKASPEEASRNFLTEYGSLFGLTDQSRELNVMKNLTGNQGNAFVRYQQVYQGVPVIAGEIIIQVDSNQQVVSAGGELTPDLNLSVTPQLTADQARSQAFAAVAKTYKVDAAHLTASTPELAVYDPRLLADRVGYGSLVWKMTVQSDGSVAASEPFEELVLVDTNTGNVTLHFNQVAEAKDRRICNLNNTSYASGSEPDCTTPVRSEGQAVTGVTDVDLAYAYSGATYDFYMTNFGRDSLNGSGLPLKNSVKLCENGYACPYANAFWSFSKQQMYYGQDYAAADDVVGHELTHGFTSFTSNLFYYYQSGAINESMSDVFGEFVDQTDGVDGAAGSDPATRWLLAEDLPIGAIRNMKTPPAYSDPDKVSSGFYYSGSNDSGGVHTNSGINNKAAYLIVDGTVAESGGTFNGQTITGIGIPKAAQVYYEVETHLLTSGSDYQDLYNYLPQACLNLLGQHGITANDCNQVKKAVTATEMNLNPAGFKPEAPICAADKSPNDVFFDNMETTGKWAFATLSGSNAWSYSTFPYNTSGTHHLQGSDLTSISDSTATMTNGVVIPANAFMHFRHYYYFDSGSSYDGAVLEYTINNGANWIDAGSLIDTNGYTGTIATGFGNPLAGRSAFTFYSTVYYSSRLNLSTLSGQTVKFRYRVGSDSSVGNDGWWIDDVRIYTCPTLPATTTALTSTANPALSGNPVTFNATVTTTGPSAPTGNVDFKDGGTTIGTVALSSGHASFTTSSLSIGSHPITAVYAGDGNNLGSTSNTVNEQINKATTTTTLTSSINPSFTGQSITLTAFVTGPGVAPTGSVTFYDNGSQLDLAVALGAGGKATYTTSSLSFGTHPITASYSGDANNFLSDSNTISQQVFIATTTVILTTSASPVFASQSVTFTAKLTNSYGGVPVGSITFYDNNSPLGSAVAVGAGGINTYSTNSLSSSATHSITAKFIHGDGNNSDSTSNTVNQQILATGCTSLTVTTADDDNSCGSLRQALAVAHAHAASTGSKVVDINVPSGGPVLLNDNSAGVTLGLGITLERLGAGCGSSGPDVFIQAGTGPTGDGLTLNGATLTGIWVSGFDGRQIVTYGGQAANTLSCVKATKTNPA